MDEEDIESIEIFEKIPELCGHLIIKAAVQGYRTYFLNNRG